MSNYIFTAIFVGEMTLKVALLHLGPLPPPAQGPLALAQPSLSLSLTCPLATFHSLGLEAGSARSSSPGAHNPPERRMQGNIYRVMEVPAGGVEILPRVFDFELGLPDGGENRPA